MTELLVMIGLTWLLSNVGNISTVMNGNYKKYLAVVAMFIGGGMAIGTAVKSWQQHYTKSVERSNNTEVDLRLNEISGGSTIGNTAYVVDDEEPTLFVSSQFDEQIGLFAHFSSRKLHFDGIEMTKENVNDLEGVAADPKHKKLYMVTSHSNNKNGKEKSARSKLLRLDLTSLNDSSIRVEAEATLRKALEKLFWPTQHRGDAVVAESRCDSIPGSAGLASVAPASENGANRSCYFSRDSAGIKSVEAVMEIEGLTIDDEGILYLGFRTPTCKDGQALIVSSEANALFEKEVSADMFHIHCVGVGDQGEGIISMEFDSQKKDILILTGSPNPYHIKNPRLCHWKKGQGDGHLRNCKDMPKLNEPTAGKQEAMLLVRSADKLITMLDTDNRLGGQVSYNLKEVGVTPTAKVK